MRQLLFLLTALIVLGSCNKKAEGGYKYVHHTKKGGKKAQVGEFAYFHVYFRNGDKLITSTRERGGVSQYKMPEVNKDGKGVIPIVAGLRLMGVGDSLTIFMPIDTIKNLPEELKGVKELAYDIVLTDVKSEADYNAEKESKEKEFAAKMEEGKKRSDEIGTEVKKVIADFKAKKLPNVVKTASGLQYYISQQGTGEKVEKGSKASVQYYGALMNGETFDDSFSRGMEPFTLAVGEGQVIPGWDEGLTYFNAGSKGYLFIPSNLAYGDKGTGPIKPNSDLIFYIEISEVTK
ncbi:MAG: FKBP-type peptidyl-prolyl cis-trans isomerase [Saprospiraceae bacterium]